MANGNQIYQQKIWENQNMYNIQGPKIEKKKNFTEIFFCNIFVINVNQKFKITLKK